MEMTYSEPQTPLFPTHVNLVREKDHRKRGESQHNTDCDVAVGIINIYPTQHLHNVYQPSRIIDEVLPDIANRKYKNR